MQKIENIPNELDDLVKKISRQTTEISTWFHLTDFDKMVEKRNKFKNYCLLFKWNLKDI